MQCAIRSDGRSFPAVTTRIDIAMGPFEARDFGRADAYVVIDALRATTTIATMFARGLARLRTVTTLDAAFAARADPEILLFGEVKGLRPDGFDYGNSPVETGALDLAGREAVLMTSNGTKALCTVAGLGPTVAGSLVNLTSVVDWASEAERAVLVCAGNRGARGFSLEDFAVAACIVQELVGRSSSAVLGDAARLALALESPAGMIHRCEHAEVTRALGFADDIAFASTRDREPSLPMVVDHGTEWAILQNLAAPPA